MNCGNCGKGNAYKATVCANCGSTLSLTDYYRPSGFVKKSPPPQTQETTAPKKLPLPKASPTTGRKPSKEAAVRKQTKPSGAKQGEVRPHSTAGKEKKPLPKGQSRQNSPKAPSPKEAPPPEKGTRKTSPKAYNRTTNNFSIAEKEVHKKTRKRSRKWIFPLVLVVVLCAIAIFVGRMQFYKDDERYTQIAEQFVQAVALNDDASASQCVHSSMHGSLRSLGYSNPERCVTRIDSYEELSVGQTGEELKNRYGIDEAVTRLFRVHVSYTVYGAQNYEGSMDVLVANIGGQICAIKTENIVETQIVPQ